MVFNIKNIGTSHRIFFAIQLATIALVIAAIGLQIFYVFNFPIWRDDAFFSSVAKNLANGAGYKAIFFVSRIVGQYSSLSIIFLYKIKK